MNPTLTTSDREVLETAYNNARHEVFDLRSKQYDARRYRDPVAAAEIGVQLRQAECNRDAAEELFAFAIAGEETTYGRRLRLKNGEYYEISRLSLDRYMKRSVIYLMRLGFYGESRDCAGTEKALADFGDRYKNWDWID